MIKDRGFKLSAWRGHREQAAAGCLPQILTTKIAKDTKKEQASVVKKVL